MREGLRSASKLPAKTNGDANLPTDPAVKDDNGQMCCDDGIKQRAFVFTPELGAVAGRDDGSRDEDLAGGINVAGYKDVEAANNVGKRRTVDSEAESGDDDVEKKVVKEAVVDDKLYVTGRVLRSRTMAKTDDGYQADRRQTEGGTVGKMTEGSIDWEKKGVELKLEEQSQSEGKISSQLDSEASKLKRKRGRPRKVLDSYVSPQKSIEVKCECAAEKSDDLYNEARIKVKGKRGRPPKALMKSIEVKYDCAPEEIDGFDNGSGNKFKAKRGRPPKAQKESTEVKNECAFEESNDLDNGLRIEFKRKRGRPPKAQKADGMVMENVRVKMEENSQFLNEVGDKPYLRVKKKKKRGRPPKCEDEKVGAEEKCKRTKQRHTLNQDKGNSELSGEGLVQKDKMKGSDDETGLKKTEQTVGLTGPSRSERKQLVRDKIVQLLISAGWTIEYRPRIGREYNDAVYVNPKGRTHWSVTLAYRRLRKHYEDGGGDSNVSSAGFKFTPIPDEELSILGRTISKERSDKNKTKKKKKWKLEGKGMNTAEGLNKRKIHKKKLHKRKPHTAGSLTSKVLDKYDPAGTSDEGATIPLGSRKRLKTHDRKRFALMVRRSKEGTEPGGDGYVLYNGKRTVLSWMINMGTVPLNAKVRYVKRRKTRVLKGRITNDGIQCDCCNTIHTVAEFEIHAGGKTCHPLKNIYLETGASLLQCQLESWYKQDEHTRRGFHFVSIDGEDPNDDTCGICGDGGNLICCDGCPSTFHQICLEIEEFPRGVWHCMYCSCKFCRMVGGEACQKDDDTAAIPTLLTCCLCEEKYHQSCMQARDDINDGPSGLAFCGKKCQEVHKRLQMLLGVQHELQEGYSWAIVHRCHVDSDISLSEMPMKVECNSKVAVALDVMDECFLPMVDHRSGVNLIHNIVYNFRSNFNRLNYSGFLTAILQRGDEIVAAASLRIHGNHLAEMPFIGTRYTYRRQGMCRRLLTAIESALCTLQVEKLIIPAISEMRETWTSNFGFKPLEALCKKRMKNMNMVVFPRVDMLQKQLLKHHLEENISGSLNSARAEECQTMKDSINDSDKRRPAGFDLNISNEDCINDASDISENMPHAGKVDGDATVFESASCVFDSCLNEGPASGEIPHSVNDGCINGTSHTPSSIVQPTVETLLKSELQLGQDHLSQGGAKISVMSYVGSYTENCRAVYSSSVVTETAPCEVKLQDGDVKQKASSLDEGSVSQDSFDHKEKLAGIDVNHEVKNDNIGYDAVKSMDATASERMQDAVNGHYHISSVNHNSGSLSQCHDPCQFTTKSNAQTSMGNGHSISKGMAGKSGPCGVSSDSVQKLKELSTDADINGIGIENDGYPVTDEAQKNTKSPYDLSSGNEIHHTSVNQNGLQNSSSVAGVAANCATCGDTPCAAAAAEVII